MTQRQKPCYIDFVINVQTTDKFMRSEVNIIGFTDQLKKARLAAGYTQQQVADLMGITNSTYSGYETGKRQPDVAKVKQLAEVLHTSGDILLETGYGEDGTIRNPRLDELSSLYQALLPEFQDYALEMIRQLGRLQDTKTNP